MNAALNATLAVTRQTVEELLGLAPLVDLEDLRLGTNGRGKRIPALLDLGFKGALV